MNTNKKTVAMALTALTVASINQSRAFTEVDNLIEASIMVLPDEDLIGYNLDNDGKCCRTTPINIDRIIGIPADTIPMQPRHDTEPKEPAMPAYFNIG